MENNGNEEEWVSKAEAVALLGTSARQVERRAEAGNIAKKVEAKQPWQKAAPVYYSKGDILALKSGTPNQHATVVPPHNGNGNGHLGNSLGSTGATPTTDAATPATLATIPTPDNALQLVSIWKDLAVKLGALAVATPATTQPTSKPWMTLAEAATWSGMPLRWIRAKAESGWEGAENIGTGKAKFWRINREALGRTMR